MENENDQSSAEALRAKVNDAMKELWECSDECGFAEDACSDLAERIERGGLADRMGLWRSTWSYMEAELQESEPQWRTVQALHRMWRDALAWSKAKGP